MRIKTVHSFGLILLLCFVVSAATIGAVQAAEEKNQAVIEVEDFRGHRLVFAEPVNRIVCLLDSALSGLYMLGVGDKVVGVSMTAYKESSHRCFETLDPRIKSKAIPAVSGSTASSLERIIALKPQLVIAWAFNQDVVNALEARGVTVYGVFIEKVADIYAEILAFGKITGRDARARELVNYTRREVDNIRNKTAAVPLDQKLRSYFMWAKGNLDSGGRNSIIHELLEVSGSRNICGDIDQEHVVISLEHLLAVDPQIIFMWYNVLQDPVDLGRLPGWKFMSATTNNRIYEMPDLFHCDLWTLNFQYALKLMAQWTYPDLFSEMDLNHERETIFKALYGSGLSRHRFISCVLKPLE